MKTLRFIFVSLMLASLAYVSINTANAQGTPEERAQREFNAKVAKLRDEAGNYQKTVQGNLEANRDDITRLQSANDELQKFYDQYPDFVYIPKDNRTQGKQTALDNMKDRSDFKRQYGADELARFDQIKKDISSAHVKRYNVATGSWRKVENAYSDVMNDGKVKELAKMQENSDAWIKQRAAEIAADDKAAAEKQARQEAVRNATFEATVLKANAQDSMTNLLQSEAERQAAFETLSRQLDNAKMGLYVQDKISRMLNSNVFCEAAQSCPNNKNLYGEKLQEIFPYTKKENFKKSSGSSNNPGQQ